MNYYGFIMEVKRVIFYIFIKIYNYILKNAFNENINFSVKNKKYKNGKYRN